MIANSSIGFIKKLFNEVTSTFVIVKRQFINKKDRFAQDNILESDLNKHGRDIRTLIISYNHLRDKLNSLSGNI